MTSHGILGSLSYPDSHVRRNERCMKELMSALGIVPASIWGTTEAGHFSGNSLVASGSSKFTGLVFFFPHKENRVEAGWFHIGFLTELFLM